MKTRLPVKCPSCESVLCVSGMSCNGCGTNVSGNYTLPVLLQLTPEEQQFVLRFLLNSGSLKEMASEMGISYPTVRNKLDDLINKVKTIDTPTAQ